MKKSINIFLSISLIIWSCSQPAPTPAPLFAAHIYYKSSGGEDLLNPQTSGGYTGADIKVYDLMINSNVQIEKLASIDETLCSTFVCGPDNDGNYFIQYRLRPSLNNLGEVIQLTASIADTLIYQIVSASPQAGYLVKQVSHGGQVLWNTGTPTPAAITIVK